MTVAWVLRRRGECRIWSTVGRSRLRRGGRIMTCRSCSTTDESLWFRAMPPHRSSSSSSSVWRLPSFGRTVTVVEGTAGGTDGCSKIPLSLADPSVGPSSSSSSTPTSLGIILVLVREDSSMFRLWSEGSLLSSPPAEAAPPSRRVPFPSHDGDDESHLDRFIVMLLPLPPGGDRRNRRRWGWCLRGLWGPPLPPSVRGWE
jgi:hypothetical protein